MFLDEHILYINASFVYNGNYEDWYSVINLIIEKYTHPKTLII